MRIRDMGISVGMEKQFYIQYRGAVMTMQIIAHEGWRHLQRNDMLYAYSYKANRLLSLP